MIARARKSAEAAGLRQVEVRKGDATARSGNPRAIPKQFRWCLSNGLRVVQPMTLMSAGLYNEPAGAWSPSILF